VNDALKPDDGKEPGAEARQPGEGEDQEDNEALGPHRVHEGRGSGQGLHLSARVSLTEKMREWGGERGREENENTWS
jgi:hypothetical protein